MLLSDAQFHQPATLEEASDLATRYGAQACLLAGGTDVLVDVKRGRFRSAHVIALSGISALRGVEMGATGIRIGAMTTINQLATAAVVRQRFPALLDATQKMAGPQIRNMATIGGNLCNANRCADLPPILLAMGAHVVLWSRAAERDLPLEEFFVAEKQTAVCTGEVLKDILVPYPPQGFGAAFARFSLRECNAIAVAGAAASLVLDAAGVVRRARIALSAAAPMPKLLPDAAAAIIGGPLDEAALIRAGNAAIEGTDTITDIRGRADFRRVLVGSLTRTALVTAHARARQSLEGAATGAGREKELS